MAQSFFSDCKTYSYYRYLVQLLKQNAMTYAVTRSEDKNKEKGKDNGGRHELVSPLYIIFPDGGHKGE